MEKGRGQNARNGNQRRSALVSDAHDMTNFLSGLSDVQKKRVPKAALLDTAIRAEPTIIPRRISVSRKMCREELEKYRARLKALLMERTKKMSLSAKKKFTTKMLRRMLEMDERYLDQLRKRGQGMSYTPADVKEGVSVLTERIQYLQHLNEEIDDVRIMIRGVKRLLKEIEEGNELKPVDSLIALVSPIKK